MNTRRIPAGFRVAGRFIDGPPYMSSNGIGINELRRRIDDIDEAMHTLLMQRGELIDAIQAAKEIGGEAGTSAMRPAREAQMLRALARRHRGAFPMASVERVWREIIGSFTQLQAPFRVMLAGADASVMTDYARHYFSVTTPVELASGAAPVIDAIGRDSDVVGLVFDEADRRAGDVTPWWACLADQPENPARVVARLPFLIDPDGSPLSQRVSYLLSRAPVEPSGEDITLAAATIRAGLDDRAARTEIELVFVEAHLGGLSLRLADTCDGPAGGLALVEILGHLPAALFAEAGTRLRWLGGYAAPLDLAARDRTDEA